MTGGVKFSHDPGVSCFEKKTCTFRSKNCAVLVQKERATRKTCTKKPRTCTAQRVTHACNFCALFAGAGRVWCAKSASNFIETFAISRENREVFPQISVQRALLSSEKPARPAQHACNDCSSVSPAFCMHLRLRSC